MTDALGNFIIAGKVYGFSRNENGFTTITTGEVVKILEKSVTLKVINKKRSLYGGSLEELKESDKVNIKTPILFPI